MSSPERITPALLSRRELLCALPLAAGGLLLTGCAAGKLAGGMIRSYQENSTHEIKADYTGLQGRSFAVVVAAHRAIRTEFPNIVNDLTLRITDRLHDHAGASGYIPARRVLAYQYDNPRWVALHPAELRKQLDNVDRLVYIDLQEFTLTERGNPYLWKGVASGLVGVLEGDATIPEEYAFTRDVSVTFPDESGLGPHNLPQDAVYTKLASRFIDRATWPFYNHEEPYYPKY
jgi:hypothetical protein